MVPGEIETTLEITRTIFGPEGETVLVLVEVTAPARRDLDDTTRRPRTIKRCRSRPLHHLDTLDIEGIEVDRARSEDHTIHDIEGITRTNDTRRTTEEDRGLLPGHPTTTDHLNTRELTLDHRANTTDRRDRELISTHLLDDKGYLHTRSLSSDTSDDQLIEIDQSSLHLEIGTGDSTSRNLDYLTSRTIADPLDHDLIAPRRKIQDQKTTTSIGKGILRTVYESDRDRLQRALGARLHHRTLDRTTLLGTEEARHKE